MYIDIISIALIIITICLIADSILASIQAKKENDILNKYIVDIHNQWNKAYEAKRTNEIIKTYSAIRENDYISNAKKIQSILNENIKDSPTPQYKE